MKSILALETQVFSAAIASPFMQPDQIEYVIVNRFVTETYNHKGQNKSHKEFFDMGLSQIPNNADEDRRKRQ